MPTPSVSLDDAGRLEELRGLQLVVSPIEPEFDNLTQLASEICDTPVALISFVDQDQIWFKSRVGFDALHGPRKDAFCSHAVQGTGPLVVEDTTADSRFQDNVYVQAPNGIRFYAGIPLVLSSGHAVGTLCVIDHKARTLSDKQLGSLKKLALQVTALIEAKRTARRLQEEGRNRLVIEQRLDFALQAADIGDWDMDLRTNVVRRSLKHDQCFGYTEAVPNWGYDTLLAHVIEADRARVDDCYQSAMAGLGVYDVEFRVLWPDQTLHWLWSKGRFYFDESGKPNRVAGIQVDITERKKTEEALQHTQTLLANAERIGQVGGWEIDVQTRQVTWTESVYVIHELDATDRLTVDEGINYYTPESRPMIELAVQRAIEQGEPFDLELEIISAKGNRRNVHAVGKPDTARGKVSGFFQDITEQRQAADVLRVSELSLQAISQGVMITGPDQLITSVNAGFTAITGYSAAEVLGRNFKFLQGPDTDPESVAAIRAALRRPAEFAGEILNYRKDGTVFWSELTIAPVFGVHGTLAHFIGITRDISMRRAAELQLRLQESQLAQADTLAGLGRWDWNLTDDSASWSDELYRIYGRDPADGVPAFDDWQETIHPEDQARLAHCIQTALAGASAYHVEFRIFTKDTGQLRYVESRGSSLVDANGKPTNIRGFDWDITERKLAEHALQAALKEKTALLKEVHHRVKNNMQVITSLLRLESGRSTVDNTKAVLGDMQARIRAMALLHESLYRTGTFASVDLGSYVRQLSTQSFQTQSPNAGTVQLALNVGSVQVGMDQAIPCGLLINELISNCLKHGFPTGVAGHVSIDLQPLDAPSQWRLRVSDTGVGLPENFEDKRKNSLGLQLATDLARQIGGALEIEPNQDKGVAFTVNFPAMEPAPLVMPA